MLQVEAVVSSNFDMGKMYFLYNCKLLCPFLTHNLELSALVDLLTYVMEMM
jgi:hypothetical protein